MISVFLRLRTRATVGVEYSIAVSDLLALTMKLFREHVNLIALRKGDVHIFLKRETALIYLTKEALVIDV